ncbi:antibiotic biosynthesis regulator FhaB [soil metagenome]
MSELTLLLLRFGLLLALWLFIFAIVYALRTDLFGQRVRRMPEQLAATPLVSATVPAPYEVGTVANETVSSGTATRLVITSGPKSGTELDLPDEPLTIGRSSESGLVIRDDYTSTHHARLMRWSDGQWVVQDLDSTNGTFLDGVRVNLPTPVPLRTPVRIGTTTFELRS